MKKRPGAVKEFAKKRVQRLLELAEKTPKYAKRYVTMARALSKKYNITIPTAWKRKICKKCNSMKQGRVRSRKGVTASTCPECGSVKRRVYKPRKAEQ